MIDLIKKFLIPSTEEVAGWFSDLGEMWPPDNED